MVNSHGHFAWYELMTTDVEGAKAFYTNVMGWSAQDASAARLEPTSCSPPERPPVSGMMNLPESARNAGASLAGSDMSGSKMWTLPPTGSSALAEPCTSRRPTFRTSAAFRSSLTRKRQRSRLLTVAESRSTRSPPSSGAPGRVGWHELFAADWEKALAFYSALFGWQKARHECRRAGHVSVVLCRRADDRRHADQARR